MGSDGGNRLEHYLSREAVPGLGDGGCGERSRIGLRRRQGTKRRWGIDFFPPSFLPWTRTGPFLGLYFFLGPKEVRCINHSRKTGLGTFAFLVYLKRTLVLLSMS